ncbi:MAG: riboflavin biosynthesis protein RibF [Sphingobacteriia bacterium]|nr:riboflavin biosynthesis protein RibF [Sphingobacteriia bacterium]
MLYRDYESVSKLINNDTVIAIGNFDGIHYGHKQVLSKAQRFAEEKGLPFIIITFEPHPNICMRGKHTHKRVLCLREKINKLKEFKPSFILAQRFNNKFASISAEDFIQKILVEKLKVLHLVVGYDFVFGKGRRGNIDFLSTMATYYGFYLDVIEKITVKNQICSSTTLRQYLSLGQIQEVNNLLGNNYSISGVVKEKNNFDDELEVKTVNLNNIDNLALRYGIYLGKVEIKGQDKKLPAIIHYGLPINQIKLNKELCKIHILDKTVEDLYKKEVKIEIEQFIRPEMLFDSLKELKEQTIKDIQFALYYFKL